MYRPTLYSLAQQTNVTIAALTTLTHFTRNSATIIDFFLLKNFPYRRDILSISELSSDHNLVFISFELSLIVDSHTNAPKINWNKFKHQLQQQHYPCRNIQTHRGIDLAIAQLESFVISTSKECFMQEKSETKYELPFELRLMIRRKNQSI